MEVEEIRQSVGNKGPRIAGATILGSIEFITLRQYLVVTSHHASEHSDVPTGILPHGVSC